LRGKQRARRVPTLRAPLEDESGDGFLPPPPLRRRVPEQGMPLVCTRLELRSNSHLPAGEDPGLCVKCGVSVGVPRHLAARLRALLIDFAPMCQSCVTMADRSAIAAAGRRP